MTSVFCVPTWLIGKVLKVRHITWLYAFVSETEADTDYKPLISQGAALTVRDSCKGSNIISSIVRDS